MKALRIDFASRSIRRSIWHVHPLGWLAATAGLMICATGAYSAFDLLEQRDAMRRESLRMQTRMAQQTAQQPVPAKVQISDSQAAAINTAVAQLNLPWRDVLNAMEAATPDTIALLSIEHDSRKHVVKGSAETKSSEAMIGYIEQLKQQEYFRDVLLTKHEINEQDPNKPLRFQFEATWREDRR